MNGDCVLRMEAVTKVHGAGEAAAVALREIDFESRSGEVVSIMGPSGAGKTTFLTIAGALLRPTGGTVSICGIDVTKLSERHLPSVRRENVGFVFQSFNLLESLTAQENVAVVMTPERSEGAGARRRAAELLKVFGMEHRMRVLPKHLSGGEKQRVAIARALANNPDLLLADEPTANLDSARGRSVMGLLRQIAAEMGKSVVIVSHDYRVREVADRVLWLEDGTFRAHMRTERDPVCQRIIEAEGAPTAEFEGQTLVFCGEECRRLFGEEPIRYLRIGQ
jgi:putative ABC transport system ATP-binding protein